MADKKASSKNLDFTNVKDRGQFSPKHQPEGEYKGQVVSCNDAKSKGDGEPMWVYGIKVGTGLYPLYCKLVEDQLWKLRNLFVAAGLTVPKKRLNVDPNKVVGKYIAVTLEDDEYEGKMKSTISSTFPLSELEDGGGDSDDEEEGDEEEEVEAPPPAKDKKKGKKSKAEPEPEPPAKKAKSGKKAEAVEAPQGKKKKSKKASDDVSDEELEELEIEDI